MSDPESPECCPPPAAPCAAVRAHGLARLREADFKASRRHPGPVPEGRGPIAPSMLRSSDEQTVAAVSAALGAVESWPGPRPDGFAGWGVVAASRFLGRSHLVVDLKRFFAEGVWGVSPHIIPHYALHSPAGTLSQALDLHGPNLGVGGGADSAFQGFLTALTWLDRGSAPGVWLVLTGWSPELVPDANGRPIDETECVALALALVPGAGADPARPRLRLASGEGGASPDPAGPIELAAELDRMGAGPSPPSRTIAADPAGRLRIEVFSARGAR